MDYKKEIIDFIKMIVIAVVVALLFTNFIARPIRVNQNSMYPTILDQSFGFTNVFKAKFLNINRFDIVVVQEGDISLIKRVVALPNETISYKDNQLYIDGFKVEEDFLNEVYVAEMIEKYGYFTDDYPEITLKDDEIFAVGDNRVVSKDSRQYGPFKLSQLKSTDLFVITPFDHFGGVN